ncbi:component of SufBCD complex [Palleronia sediminis]|uniref:Component of SufBCD complex n=1 Tax=Palleronia sediminis TaxID=2547833 RepID=A0A4R6AQ01_9RHOB|nr:component of SufBCD complex [Palleronia sediminis]TDL84106.1 component of SufBCD complex [Palleronia sediminis]
MDWYGTIFELIDMRSFSNLWYWIALATVWSTAGHYVLGIPYDMVGRAARGGEGAAQAEADLAALTDIRVRRILYIAEVAGLWLVAIAAAVLTALLVLATVYGVEFAQAVILIAAPMTGVGALSVRTAARIADHGLEGAALRRTLGRHRLIVQAIGLVSVFVTAMWGMFVNLYVGPLL